MSAVPLAAATARHFRGATKPELSDVPPHIERAAEAAMHADPSAPEGDSIVTSVARASYLLVAREAARGGEPSEVARRAYFARWGAALDDVRGYEQCAAAALDSLRRNDGGSTP